MIQLEEHLRKKGHDTHMVANITKKIGEWSVLETAGEYASLSQENLEEKTERNRALGAEENRALGGLDRQQVKEIEASSQQGPSAQSSIRKKFMM